MYNNILIPIDMAHPEKAGKMIGVAKQLAGPDTRYNLATVIHEIPSYAPVDLTSDYFDSMKSSAKEKLSQIAGEASLDANIEILVGETYPSILAVAEKNKADLIIIGSHRPGFSDYLLGSTAARVVRHAGCPVFVLR